MRNEFYFIFLIFLSPAQLAVVLPLKILSKENYLFNNEKTPTETMQKIYHHDIYALFKISKPIQTIPLFIDLFKEDFYLTSSNMSLSEQSGISYINNTYNFSSTFSQFYFNESIATSFKKSYQSKSFKPAKGYSEITEGKDIWYFNNDLSLNDKYNNYIIVEQFPISIVKDQVLNFTGVLGLLSDSKLDYGLSSSAFLPLLKSLNIINHYYFSFVFTNRNNKEQDNIHGYLIVGETLHDILPKKFSEKSLFNANIVKYAQGTNYLWKTQFEKIFFPNIENTIIHLNKTMVEFAYNIDVLIGTHEFEKIMKEKFFNRTISEGLCFREKFYQRLHVHYDYSIYFYYCEKSLKSELFNILPYLKFFSEKYNFVFTLENYELFVEKGDYLYFKIVFHEHQDMPNWKYENVIWTLGWPFTKKYQFIFNQEYKTIGFYLDEKKDNNEENMNVDDNHILSLVIKILIIFFLTALIIYLGIKFTMLRIFCKKKRANELDDDYDYIQENNSNTNSNNEKNISIGKIN